MLSLARSPLLALAVAAMCFLAGCGGQRKEEPPPPPPPHDILSSKGASRDFLDSVTLQGYSEIEIEVGSRLGDLPTIFGYDGVSVTFEPGVDSPTIAVLEYPIHRQGPGGMYVHVYCALEFNRLAAYSTVERIRIVQDTFY